MRWRRPRCSRSSAASVTRKSRAPWPSGSWACRPACGRPRRRARGASAACSPRARVRAWSTRSSSVGVLPGTRRDHGGDRFAEARVGHADDDRVEDVGVALEHRLDLFGEHLLAARVDALRSAAEHGDRAVVLDHGAVAGDRPAHAVELDERRRGLLPRPCSSRPARDRARASRPSSPTGGDLAVVGDDRRPLVHAEARTLVGHVDRAVGAGLGRAERVEHDRVRQPLVDLGLDRRARGSHRPRRSRGRSAARSRAPSASTSGRAIASPTRLITSTCSRSTRSQISSASNRRPVLSTTVLPPKSAIDSVHCALPCISGASASVAAGRRRDVVGDLLRLRDRRARRSSRRRARRRRCPPARHITPLGMPVVPPV